MGALQNLTAKLELELSLLEQVGGLALEDIAINETVTVPANGTYLYATEVNDHNGTLNFVFPNSCSSDGSSANFHGGTADYHILLDSKSGGLTSTSTTINSTQFAIYFDNIGPSSVSCTLSIVYVYDTA